LGLLSRGNGCCSIWDNFLDIYYLLDHLSIGARERLLIPVDNPIDLYLTINADDVSRLDNDLLLIRGLAPASQWGDICWQGRDLDPPDIGTRFNKEVVGEGRTQLPSTLGVR